MKQRKTTGLALGAACVLFCLVLISSHIASGLLAKYVVNVPGSDSGRGAAFRVNAAMTGEDGIYGLTFTNDAETAVSYSVKVQPKDPGMFSAITLGSLTAAADATGAVVFPDVGTLAPGAVGTAALTLLVNPAYADPDATEEPGLSGGTSAAETELPFTVTVTFVQID